jgi:hypothetical protein
MSEKDDKSKQVRQQASATAGGVAAQTKGNDNITTVINQTHHHYYPASSESEELAIVAANWTPHLVMALGMLAGRAKTIEEMEYPARPMRRALLMDAIDGWSRSDKANFDRDMAVLARCGIVRETWDTGERFIAITQRGIEWMLRLVEEESRRKEERRQEKRSQRARESK